MIVVRYLAQLRPIAGRGEDRLPLAGPCTVAELLRRLAADERLRRALLDDAGEARASLLVFVGDERAEASRLLRDGDEVTLMTPIAGGAT